MTKKYEKEYLSGIYNYLVKYHLGEENADTRENISKALCLDERELRRITSAINKSSDFEKLVSTKNTTYICNTKEECIGAILNTYKLAITQFKKARAMQTKLSLQGQIKMPLNGEEIKEIIEVYGSGLSADKSDRENE